MMAGKVVGLGFEIISKLDSYFLMTVSFSLKKMELRSKPRIFYINRIFGKGKLKK